MKQPLVSVVTPVYNEEKNLAECIESVLAQTYPNWEYVIVNNRSTDRSLEIAQRYAAQDARIRVYDNREFFSELFLITIVRYVKSPRRVSTAKLSWGTTGYSPNA